MIQYIDTHLDSKKPDNMYPALLKISCMQMSSVAAAIACRYPFLLRSTPTCVHQVTITHSEQSLASVYCTSHHGELRQYGDVSEILNLVR